MGLLMKTLGDLILKATKLRNVKKKTDVGSFCEGFVEQNEGTIFELDDMKHVSGYDKKETF